jgi:predicted NAD-dependent protein-ADP-ribosyltransferase YbiA (DUF1768 family)
MLSNFWRADVTLGQRTYRTVEHAFQAAKIALVDPALAETFALESGADLARGDVQRRVGNASSCCSTTRSCASGTGVSRR